MIIYTTSPKSKKRKPNAKKRALAASWQEILKKHNSNKLFKKTVFEQYVPPKPKWIEPGRDPKAYASVNTDYHDTSKKTPIYYTGDKMKGIGTLHKSNAVPIFSEEEAKDQANMRR
jgi:hypothetical protein